MTCLTWLLSGGYAEVLCFLRWCESVSVITMKQRPYAKICCDLAPTSPVCKQHYYRLICLSLDVFNVRRIRPHLWLIGILQALSVMVLHFAPQQDFAFGVMPSGIARLDDLVLNIRGCRMRSGRFCLEGRSRSRSGFWDMETRGFGALLMF
jgi:hypothetical protein